MALQKDLSNENIEIEVNETGTYYWYIISQNSFGRTKGEVSIVTIINPLDLPSVNPVTIVKSIKGQATVSSSFQGYLVH